MNAAKITHAFPWPEEIHPDPEEAYAVGHSEGFLAGHVSGSEAREEMVLVEDAVWCTGYGTISFFLRCIMPEGLRAHSKCLADHSPVYRKLVDLSEGRDK